MRRSNITKAIRFVEKKLPNEVLSVKEANIRLFGEGWETKIRADCNKQEDNFLCCFIDGGHYNYYNIDRIMAGKVKAFQGNTPRERLLCALEDLYKYCDSPRESVLSTLEVLHRYCD